MEKMLFLEVYLITTLCCFALTIIISRSLRPGLNFFLSTLTHDAEITRFFVRMVTLIFILGGFGAGLANGYLTDEKANWLTLSWDAVDQMQGTMNNLFGILITLTIVFFIMHLVNRKLSK